MAPEHVKLQYEENARVAAAFWEWRHKLMTFSFAVLSGLVVVVGWLVRHNVSHRLVALPLGMGAMLARLRRERPRCISGGGRCQRKSLVTVALLSARKALA